MNENFIDYYKILDVDIEATSGEIRNNYLKLAKKNHPDQGGNSEMFQLICKGYECLYNKETRKEYDLIYLKRSFDELKEDELVKFKGEFNEFVSTNVKSINEEKINELFSEIFKDAEEIKDQKLNDIDLEKRITDIYLERETQDIETKDDAIKNLLDNEQELNINDIYEFTKQKYGYENTNTNIINNEIGTADLLQFDKYGSYELLNNDNNYVSNI
jgi:DnaJ-class molecular chaperone